MSVPNKVVVVGSGVAGLTTALALVEVGIEVVIVTKSRTSDSATWYAQGGIASAMFPDDSIESHIQDTLDAGAGLCDLDAVEVLVKDSTSALELLISRGAQFDRLADGTYARTREGGHHNNRIIHAGGDATGEEIERSLVKVATDETMNNLHILDFHMVTRLLVEDDRCVGIECIDAESFITQIEADAVVLATGGAGQLFSVTTNPLLATGDGIALALNAGVACADLEFMQFHPTALHIDNMPRPLLSEALRGEGAILRDGNGVAFMQGVHELVDLAPRDVVSREIARILNRDNVENVFLDATNIENFSNRFPTIFSSCEAAGVDPSKEFLPVSPAAHYFCGGIATDIDGATSLAGLFAAGEVACNGVHGANRLASNSLLDGLVFGQRVANALIKGKDTFEPTGILQPLPGLSRRVRSLANDSYSSCDPKQRQELQKLNSRNVGVLRDNDLLLEAKEQISKYINIETKQPTFADIEMNHLVDLANAMINSAIAREESRGCHRRSDFTQPLDEFKGRFYTTNFVDEPMFVPL